MSKIKRIIALAMASAMVTATMTSCNNTPAESSKAPAESKAPASNGGEEESLYATEIGDFPIYKGDEDVKVSLGIEQSVNVLDYETNLFSLYLEEKTGIDIVFDIYPQGGAAQQITTAIESGTELPEMLIRNMGDSGNVYGGQGIFVDLADRFADPEKSPYFHSRTESGEFDEYLPFMYASDGACYAIPTLLIQETNDFCRKGWLNQTWLDKSGMEFPETTEEFAEVMHYFVTNDMNENGTLDEIGVMGSTNGWSGQSYEWIMNPFVQGNPDQNWLYFGEDNKTVEAAYIQDGWRQGIEYMRDMIAADESFSPLGFTTDVAALNTMFKGAETTIVGCLAGSRPGYDNDDGRRGEYTVVTPLVGPDGQQNATVGNSSVLKGCMYITKYCENVDAAFALADFMLAGECTIFDRYGSWDEDLTIYEGDDRSYLNTAVEPQYNISTTCIWGTANNSHWGQVIPRLQSDALVQEYVEYDKDTWDDDWSSVNTLHIQLRKATDLVKEYAPEKVYQHPVQTQEELEEINKLQADISKYVSEQRSAFAMGVQELNDDTWAAYVDYLTNELNYERVVELRQAGWDRMLAK